VISATSKKTNRLTKAWEKVRDELLALRNEAGHWEGELSESALSTATAIMAFEMARRNCGEEKDRYSPHITNGLDWLATHQNEDGGWGDTVKSVSNISTTMLSHAVFHATNTAGEFAHTVERAKQYIDHVGGIAAVVKRYGKDKTFSIPILTHCALAGLVPWKEVSALPFELACIPAKFYKTVKLPVVSYALPALIAIGQVRYHFRKPRNPISRILRNLSIKRSLNVLEKIQPPNGGFLEAAPLTSFVTMSLIAKGLYHHPVVQKGLQFLIDSVRPDGSWPIDTNLATWVTTLSVNALKNEVPKNARDDIRNWLLAQQYTELHPYTHANPGGWAWTDLPGGVPDADDTPGAILALLNLGIDNLPQAEFSKLATSLENGIGWLLDIQNRDKGWPTFCKGWGTLPFDRSAADISAHVLRSLIAWWKHPLLRNGNRQLKRKAFFAIDSCFGYLAKSQRDDGSWLPLWFGNQHTKDDENPTYGTARVLAAYRDAGKIETNEAQSGLKWLRENQNNDGGWGGCCNVPSSIEESSLAMEILLSIDDNSETTQQGLQYLLHRIDEGTHSETSPIGFYFAKLWYFEKLYPTIFLASALKRANESSHWKQLFVTSPENPLSYARSDR